MKHPVYLPCGIMDVMANTFRAMAAPDKTGTLRPMEFDAGELGSRQVEIAVDYCGICHSDLSMLHNHWGQTAYPFVPGHEIVGRVVAAGAEVRGLAGGAGDPLGKTVGVGWFTGSCLGCRECLSGHHNLCASSEQTIVGRHGGFASRVRANWEWTFALDSRLDPSKAGPLFCGGITVFYPIVASGVKPTDRVGVIGIGGLGHLAVQFLNKWGCEVYAFSSNPAKTEELKRLGAHHVVDSRSAAELKKLRGSLNFIVSTVNVSLDWNAVLGALAPRGTLHFVGAVLDPVPVAPFSLIGSEKRITGSPLGGPAVLLDMLDFCGRHDIAPVVERYKMSQADEALAHLEAGQARYRIVLENDLG
jgi:uncharacterized zinc-type alcohol dehydrogenase-like protein